MSEKENKAAYIVWFVSNMHLFYYIYAQLHVMKYVY